MHHGFEPASRGLAAVHAVARVALAVVFLWHGIVPKLLYRHPDELELLRDSGQSASGAVRTVMIIGWIEVAYAVALLVGWRVRALPLAATVAMVVITPGIMLNSPRFIPAAFTPVTLNLCVAVLGVIAWMAADPRKDTRDPGS